MLRAFRSVVAWPVVLGLGCASPKPVTGCQSIEDCPAGAACVAGTCKDLCAGDRDCDRCHVCSDGVCVSHECRPETCTDGLQNGDETGVDCGGSCLACPACDDQMQNGNETGVDCGGVCPACPPLFRSASSATGTTTSVTVDVPVGVLDGDALVAAVSGGNSFTGTTAAPPDWLLLDRVGPNAVNHTLEVWHKIAATEPPTYTWAGDGGEKRVVLIAFSGVSATPIDAYGGQMNNLGGTSITAPSITTTVASTMLVYLAEAKNGISATPPGGMTEAAEIGTDSAGGDSLLEMAYEILPLAGATGTRAATAQNGDKSIGYLVALAPAP